MVYWAGLWKPKRFEALLYRALVRMHLLKRENIPQIGFWIPYRKLRKYYSNLDR